MQLGCDSAIAGNVAIAARCPAHPILLPQVMQIAVAVLKGTNKPALYRGCTKDELLQLVRSDDRRLYVMLYNIDGPGELSLQTAAVALGGMGSTGAAGCDGQARFAPIQRCGSVCPCAAGSALGIGCIACCAACCAHGGCLCTAG